jgi:hypothetical protein
MGVSLAGRGGGGPEKGVGINDLVTVEPERLFRALS